MIITSIFQFNSASNSTFEINKTSKHSDYGMALVTGCGRFLLLFEIFTLFCYLLVLCYTLEKTNFKISYFFLAVNINTTEIFSLSKHCSTSIKEESWCGMTIQNVDGLPMACGGYQDKYNDKCKQLDPNAGQWSLMEGSLIHPVWGASSVPFRNTMVVLGGFDGKAIRATVQEFSITSKTWHQLEPMPEASFRNCAVDIDDKR